MTWLPDGESLIVAGVTLLLIGAASYVADWWITRRWRTHPPQPPQDLYDEEPNR